LFEEQHAGSGDRFATVINSLNQMEQEAAEAKSASVAAEAVQAALAAEAVQAALAAAAAPVSLDACPPVLSTGPPP